MITPTSHEKAEWSRMATAAYKDRQNMVGHIYSAAAALPNGESLKTERYDTLQNGYRGWLCFGHYPSA